jgi:hypothetical protein
MTAGWQAAQSSIANIKSESMIGRLTKGAIL